MSYFEITCPFCGTEEEYPLCFDECKVKDGRLYTTVQCEICENCLDLEIEVEDVFAKCLTVNDEPTAEELAEMHADDMIDLQRDIEMGIE